MEKENLPTNRELIIPTIIALKQLSGKGTNSEIFNKICSNERFTHSQLRIKKTGNSDKSELENRADWARTILRGAKIIDSISRGSWKLVNSNFNPKSITKEEVYEIYSKNIPKKTQGIHSTADSKNKVSVNLKSIVIEPEISIAIDKIDFREFYKENISKKEISEIRDLANKLNSHLKKKGL